MNTTEIATTEDIRLLRQEIRALRESLSGCTIVPAPEWVSIKEAAKRFDVSVATIHRWIDEERLEDRGQFKLREVFAPWSMVNQYLEARERDPDLPVPRPSEQRRKAVYERDGRVCSYCGCTEGPFHIDHIHPRSRGGTNDMENLTVACEPCNREKGNKTTEEWLN